MEWYKKIGLKIRDECKGALINFSESGYFLSAETYEGLLEAGRKGQ